MCVNVSGEDHYHTKFATSLNALLALVLQSLAVGFRVVFDVTVNTRPWKLGYEWFVNSAPGLQYMSPVSLIFHSIVT